MSDNLLVRIVYMLQPLSFYNFINYHADPFLMTGPTCISLVTTLMIAFYWHELIQSVSQQLTSKLVLNISKITTVVATDIYRQDENSVHYHSLYNGGIGVRGRPRKIACYQHW